MSTRNIYSSRGAYAGGTKLASAGLSSLTTPRYAAGDTKTTRPKINTNKIFDEIEHTFQGWISGSAQGKHELWRAWHSMDINGNNIVSLAEIDNWVENTFPPLNHKPALIRAYKASSKVHGDEYVHKSEFPILVRNIVYFNKLWHVFDDMDASADRHLTFQEFRNGLAELGMPQHTNALEIFQQLDTNRGGVVLFDEFCKWVAAVRCPVDSAVYDSAILSPSASKSAGEFTHFTKPQKTPRNATQKDKLSSALAECEKKIKDLMKDKRKLQSFWRGMDYNGNGIVSLAEIDKAVSENYPCLDNKPALIRAYKASQSRGTEGDGFVHKHDFRKLVRNIMYFNKCWNTFEVLDADHDRRMTLQEFQGSCEKLGMHLSAAEMRDEFQFMDENNGGKILFDEFCKWVGEKNLPL